jgi:hypothetical protein
MMFMQAGGLQPGTGIVMGAIRTTEGRPAVGLRVAAVAIDDPDGNNLLSIGTTDSSGRYRLSNIPQGSYYIVAGRLARLTYFPAGSDASGAKQIVVEAARVVPGIDFTVPPDSVPIAPSLAKNRATEVLDFVMIGSETNLDRKLKLLQKYQKDYPNSEVLPHLFPLLMEVYVGKENTPTALAFTQKVLRAGADNVNDLVDQSKALASQSHLEKAIQTGEQAVVAAEKLKNRHPQAPYDGPAFNSWVGTFEREAKDNLSKLKTLAATSQLQETH